MRDGASKPRMHLSRIVEMNLGFLGIQFSFGLQQANMGPIYRYLGADEAHLRGRLPACSCNRSSAH